MASADQPANCHGHLWVKKLSADLFVRRHQDMRLLSPVWVRPGLRAMPSDDLVNVFLDRAFPSGLDPRMAQLMDDPLDLVAAAKTGEPLGNLVAELYAGLWSRRTEHVRAGR